MEWKIAIANKSSFAERLMFLYYTLHKTFLPDTVYLTQMSSKHHHFIIKQYIRLFTLEYRRLVTDGWWLRLESVYLAAAEMGCVMCGVWILFSPQLWSSIAEARICCCCYDEDNTSVTAWTQAWSRRNLHWQMWIVYAASRGDSGTFNRTIQQCCQHDDDASSLWNYQ